MRHAAVFVTTLAALLLLPPAAQARGEDAIAVVLGRPIHASALAPSAQERERVRRDLSPERYARWEEDVLLRNLRGALLGPLLQAFVRERRLEPTVQELQAAVEGMDRHLAAMRRSAPPELRRVLEEFDAMEESDAAEVAARTTPEQRAVAARDGVRPMVVAWKVQRELHALYGGHMYFQQSGPEAEDAYAPFLEEREYRGDFRIPDARLRSRFWAAVRKMPLVRFRMDAGAELRPWWENPPVP